MPISGDKIAGAPNYADPFLGPVDHTAHLKIDVSQLTTAEVDARGCLKPNVPFLRSGGRPVGAAGEAVYGVSLAPVKLAGVGPNPTNASLAATTQDQFVAVATIAQLQRHIARDNLGRDFSASEITAFGAAGCHISLTNNA